ncbi:MAG: peptide-N-glycosidase F-related protein [Oligoflexales bacterium]
MKFIASALPRFSEKLLSGVLSCLLLVSCVTKSSESESMDASAQIKTVRVFSSARIDVDNRDVFKTVAFPPLTEDFSQIELELTLGCPDNLCDWWDRPGAISIVTDDQHPQKEIEILRFMTPYRVGGTWSIDVTHLRPILKDSVKFKVHITTGVKEGHENGNGWLVSVKTKMKRGTPESRPIAVVPMIPSQFVEYGNPLAGSSIHRIVGVPPGVAFSKARAFTTITGHGQGNRFNCAEFCDRKHYISIGNQTAETRIARFDCKNNPINNQYGNWEGDREGGWCPGDIVKPWTVDIQDGLIGAGGAFQFKYFPEPYHNTCRPGVGNCTGCAQKENPTCEFNGGTHTLPRWWVSSYLVLYE